MVSSERVIDFLCTTVILHIKAFIPTEFREVHRILDLYKIFSPSLHRALLGDYNMSTLGPDRQLKRPRLDPDEVKVLTLSDRAEVRCFYSTAIKEGFIVIVR